MLFLLSRPRRKSSEKTESSGKTESSPEIKSSREQVSRTVGTFLKAPVPLQPRAGEAADLVQLVDEKGLSFGLKVWIKFCTKRCYRKADDRAVELAAGIAANANGTVV
ncbi:hypothetical protein DTO027I6_3207 [Penicillium roqueforti]|uniref:uncharacterized protein n=1 Tax=Penicillium roqueforti TaxID=5082 RepID=UPI00190C3F25|nr:uncharacterized protein LCP9604111_307 [Penicillium roqueforti]KAF9252781.1 hypothetical protein LCP9604111_307 [Penicillium roqueforti]KAI1830707.1 hypothetical protein CBS147337_8555 [Penicillium roqueforti]KAI2675323.1 hypothetical protein CBS147355_6317 [Penicillium roqueforti]KAI2679199.1 hypothetical protein LCP963914a_7298 [Penicillium roqueforti]KAI2724206.1 hypothetical protein CBS147318_1137 [Penicillium roqueforti]